MKKVVNYAAAALMTPIGVAGFVFGLIVLAWQIGYREAKECGAKIL